ncbi:hypothetical protein TNCT_674391 [Trichonephila clavata]|uniref:Uncharacterized protein n=1 Tax=Trichonephila clavata TaxID=2740835 RepID=A0A8X6FXF0_TRICU|nr:hypothetical protein TNCT_674391 [Trichonephila clavata]
MIPGRVKNMIPSKFICIMSVLLWMVRKNLFVVFVDEEVCIKWNTFVKFVFLSEEALKEEEENMIFVYCIGSQIVANVFLGLRENFSRKSWATQNWKSNCSWKHIEKTCWLCSKLEKISFHSQNFVIKQISFEYYASMIKKYPEDFL